MELHLHPLTHQAYKLLHDGALALARAERQGMRVDKNYIHTKRKELDEEIGELERKLEGTNFYRHWVHSRNERRPNLNSGAQLSKFLYKVKKLTPAKLTPSGQGSTNEEALSQLAIPELDMILRIRKLKKINETYLDNFLREQTRGYIHPFFNLHLVKTFRSSSDKPNFQNIPKRDKEAMQIVRRALYPRPGHMLLEVDYSGLEVRIAACYHKDPNMLQYIRTDADMHGDIAKEIYKLDEFDKSIEGHAMLRAAAKNGFVFPQFYGDYYANCAYSLACGWGKLPPGTWERGQGIIVGKEHLSDHLIDNKISSLGKFTRHVQRIEDDFWGNKFAVYSTWKERWYGTYRKYGYIDLLTGFRCGGVMGKNDSINYPVQGAAFHCLLWSFIELDRIMREEEWDTKLIGQIHDAILFDVHPKELDHVIKTIHRVTCDDLPKAWPWIIVPLEVEAEICDVDEPWSEKKDI